MLPLFLQFSARRAVSLLGLTLLLIGLPGCESKESPSSYVARVGNHYLTQDELTRRLEDLGPIPDSTEARQQIIDQWITRTLLYREALRLNLESVEDVQRKLKQQRRLTLVTAMTNRIYDQAERTPSQEEVRTYFERHNNQLRLREPYVDVRYLATESHASAQKIRQMLAERPSLSDSTWRRLVRTHAVDSTRAVRVSRRLLPESRLARALPFTADQIAALDEGEGAPIVQRDNQYHLLQLVRRVPKGSAPKLSWFEDEIRRRLRIRARKQTYTREVQRLRSKARASGALETP